MTLDEMMAMVHATRLPITLPEVIQPIDVDAELLRFFRRAHGPSPQPDPAGFSFTVTRFVEPITCTREELGQYQAPWGWP